MCVCVCVLCDRLQSKYTAPFPRWSGMKNLATNDTDKPTFTVCLCLGVRRKPAHVEFSHFANNWQLLKVFAVVQPNGDGTFPLFAPPKRTKRSLQTRATCSLPHASQPPAAPSAYTGSTMGTKSLPKPPIMSLTPAPGRVTQHGPCWRWSKPP